MSLEQRTELMQGNFFELDWAGIINDIEEPVLITGNPPWVTSSNLGTIQSNNLPQKSNFQKQKGYDAITGKSNFDISEWMLIKYLDWMKNKRGAIAILCKFSVAKKVLLYAHKNGISLSGSNIYLFDAKRYFDVSVEACFFITHFQPNITSYECNVYTSLDSINPISIITCKNGLLISDNTKYTKWQHLFNPNNVYQWRSGIKHDCSKIMELERMGNEYKNTLNEVVSLEETYLYPLLKSSDISNGKPRYGSKFVIVTQEYIGQDTERIKNNAQATWNYLEAHKEAFSKRSSSIYKNKPKYSIFGVGPYSFAPWKVAISGFYKKLGFKVIEPFENKPVFVDDTVYFIPCNSVEEAEFVADLLNSEPAREYYESMIFWSDKRPITLDLLKRLSLHELSKELNLTEQYVHYAAERLKNKEQLALTLF